MYIKEWTIHGAALVIVILIFIRTYRRLPVRDMLLVFFIQAYISSFFGVLVVSEGWIDYPVRLLPQYFDSSILFEYVAFPASCVLFYETTLKANHSGILFQAVLYSSIMTLVEVALERNSMVIQYHAWDWYDSFASLALTFLLVRYLIAGIRHLSAVKAS
ncbi:CBO0543 family protein [Gorillibacterium sp. sgz5001074]|uniref:CBO0543 family protein n=1 Tax=Gorillibacterium sp. sgz5001074 TaxID=3446695 RepID=UPI003F664B0A